MGRRGGRRNQRGRRRDGPPDARPARAPYREVPKENALYEKYYNEAGLVPAGERDAFWTAMRRELPNSFRFAGSKAHALSVQKRLKERYIPELTGIEYEGQPVEAPTPLPWYPNELAWQMTSSKKVIRRSPQFSSFQKFLVSETGVGNMSRQEAVSMIPPLVMDVQPGMTVLDLCAAPGSKSAQLLEMLHEGEEARMRKVIREMRQKEGRAVSPDGDEIQKEMAEEEQQRPDWAADDGRATGLLVANDVDYQRTHMLIHQLKRLNSPNLLVTNHDATLFPSIKLPSDPNDTSQTSRAKYLKFDRILADVPCSGDGTARKNPNVWRDWTPVNALGLHSMQLRILIRSLQMLKVGGRVVYSTCSMNPVENEAVVAAAIERCGGISKVGIVDCTDALPGLHRRSGVDKWSVMDRQGHLWSTWDEFRAYRDEHEQENLGKIAPSFFPDPQSETSPHLTRCIRVYPHQQDTGAFFIAVLEKKAEIRARTENDFRSDKTDNLQVHSSNVAANGHSKTTNDQAVDGQATDSKAVPTSTPAAESTPPKRSHEANGNAEEPAAKRAKTEQDLQDEEPPSAQVEVSYKRKNNQALEEPYTYLPSDHEVLQTIYTFYGLHDRFPRHRFMVRNAAGTPSKIIYLTSSLVRDILRENEGKGFKFIHAGVRMFVKQEVPRPDVCRWRIQSEGLPLVDGWIGDQRVVRLYRRSTLRQLLVEMFPRTDGPGLVKLGEVGEQVQDMNYGCCVLHVEKGDGDEGFPDRMVLPLWRSLHSLNLMLQKEDRKAMLLRLYNEDVPVVDNSNNSKKKDGEKKALDVSIDNAAQHPDLDDKKEDSPSEGQKEGSGEGLEGDIKGEGDGLNGYTAADDEKDVAAGSDGAESEGGVAID